LIDKFDSEFLDLFKEAITEYLTEPEEAGEWLWQKDML
jgi:hypothetical protein